MFGVEPTVISSFVNVRAAWSSWGRPAFCKALRWCQRDALWGAARTPRSRRRTCPFARPSTPPWVVPPSCWGATVTGSRSARAPGASSPLLQTSPDCRGEGPCYCYSSVDAMQRRWTGTPLSLIYNWNLSTKIMEAWGQITLEPLEGRCAAAVVFDGGMFSRKQLFK